MSSTGATNRMKFHDASLMRGFLATAPVCPRPTSRRREPSQPIGSVKVLRDSQRCSTRRSERFPQGPEWPLLDRSEGCGAILRCAHGISPVRVNDSSPAKHHPAPCDHRHRNGCVAPSCVSASFLPGCATRFEQRQNRETFPTRRPASFLQDPFYLGFVLRG